MKTRKHFIDEYHAAMAEETRLWEIVKGQGPGQPGYDPRQWQLWLDAVGVTTAASRALREAFADISPGRSSGQASQ